MRPDISILLAAQEKAITTTIKANRQSWLPTDVLILHTSRYQNVNNDFREPYYTVKIEP